MLAEIHTIVARNQFNDYDESCAMDDIFRILTGDADFELAIKREKEIAQLRAHSAELEAAKASALDYAHVANAQKHEAYKWAGFKDTEASLVDRAGDLQVKLDWAQLSERESKARLAQVARAVRKYFEIKDQAREDYCSHRYWFRSEQLCSDLSWAFQRSLVEYIEARAGESAMTTILHDWEEARMFILDDSPDEAMEEHVHHLDSYFGFKPFVKENELAPAPRFKDIILTDVKKDVQLAPFANLPEQKSKLELDLLDEIAQLRANLTRSTRTGVRYIVGTPARSGRARVIIKQPEPSRKHSLMRGSFTRRATEHARYRTKSFRHV